MSETVHATDDYLAHASSSSYKLKEIWRQNIEQNDNFMTVKRIKTQTSLSQSNFRHICLKNLTREIRHICTLKARTEISGESVAENVGRQSETCGQLISEDLLYTRKRIL